MCAGTTTVAFGSHLLPTMAATHAVSRPAASLDLISEEGRSVLPRSCGETPGSPQLDRRGARVGGNLVCGGSSIRRSVSLGSGLSGVFGNGSSRNALEGNSLRRTSSRGCLDILESGSLKAMMGELGEGSRERFEGEFEWSFNQGMNIQSESSSVQKQQERPSFNQFETPVPQSFGKGDSQELKWDPIPFFGERAKLNATTLQVNAQRSVVLDQAQGALDSLKDRLESSLKSQPECSYGCYASQSFTGKVVETKSKSQKRVRAVRGLAKDVCSVSIPSSLRRVRRRNGQVSGDRVPEHCAIQNAFSSMVYIIRAMHSHALEMQQTLNGDKLQNVMTPVHREMNLSFVWLFQQVFVSAPEFMLSIMVLLANFAVYSLGENLALAAAVAMASPASQVSPVQHSNSISTENTADYRNLALNLDTMLELPSAHGSENLRKIGNGSWDEIQDSATDGGGDERDDSVAGANISTSPSSSFVKFDTRVPAIEDSSLQTFMEDSLKEMGSTTGWQQPLHLNREVAKKLVAPVHVALSPDSYPCFDRTDLEYQHSIDLQPSNVLLLANYAQFLHVVRHDINRAEEYFHRAMQADPADGEVLGRFASFLWLARGDKDGAERAFRAAAACDSTNPYHAGNYSHFMWHAGDGDESCCTFVRRTGMA